MMKKEKTKTLHLPILVEQDEDNYYIVSCPVFKGCNSYGAAIDEALSNIMEVIDMCIEEEEKEKIPISTALSGSGNQDRKWLVKTLEQDRPVWATNN